MTMKTVRAAAAAKGARALGERLASGAGALRLALLAGASAIAFGTFGAPSAEAGGACAPSTQTVTTTNHGPVTSNGGAISVTAGASIAGDTTAAALAQDCGVSGGVDNLGAIDGATGAAPLHAAGGPGGAGVLDIGQTIRLAEQRPIHRRALRLHRRRRRRRRIREW